MIPFPNKKYKIIYADPPWPFNFHKRNLKDKSHLYKIMTIDEIKQLPIQNISDNDCILFL